MKRTKLLLILAILVALTMVIAACGEDCAHEQFGEWKITKAPTADALGEAIRVCGDCGIAETVSIAKLSDTSVWTASASTATHTSAGKIVYTSTYGSVEIFVDRLSDHVYDKEVATDEFLVSEADCTHAAVYRKSCVCGAVDAATFTSGSVLGHDGKPVQAVEAVHTETTLANGVNAHYECDRCGKLFSDADCEHEVTAESLVIIAAHDYGTITVTKNATCTEAGSATHSCTVCGKNEIIVLDALGHDYTSGKMALVTTRSDYQDEDGTIIEGDETATEFHAPVCDVCRFINEDAKVAHTYGPEGCIAEKDHIGHDVRTIKSCTACGHSVKGDISLGYIEMPTSGWVKDEDASKPVSYTEDGYDIYKKGNHTVKVPIAKLVAAFEGRTYNSIWLQENSNTAHALQITPNPDINLTIDSVGTGVGHSYPLNGNVVIATTDGKAVKVNDYSGYVHDSTGLIVLVDNGNIFLLTPYSTDRNLINGSCFGTSMMLTYHIDCGVYTGHDVNIYVDPDGVVHFGVIFMAGEGDVISAEQCRLNDMFGVMADYDEPIAIYVKGDNGVYRIADEYLGEYEAAASSSLDVGTITVNGFGGWTCTGKNDIKACGGTYAKRSDGKFDIYVVAEGKNIQYYIATIDVELYTYSLEAQNITITLNAGDHGTVTPTSISNAFANCIAELPVPTVNAGDDYMFIGWYNGENRVNEDTTFAENVTLTARWANKVTVIIHDGESTREVVIGAMDPVISALSNYKAGETVNPANNMMFVGLYANADLSGDPLDEEAVSDSETLDVYMKWVPAGRWNAFKNDGTNFVYNAETKLWKATKYNVTTSTLFEAVDGDIVVSFDFYFNNNGNYDEVIIKNGNVTLVNIRSNASGAPMIDSKQSIKAVVKSGTSLTFQNKLWISTTNSGIFIENLTINGRAVTTKGLIDFMEGAYSNDGEDLVLDGYGAFTWGDKSGTYSKTSENAIEMYVMDGSTKKEYYTVTLNGSSCIIVKPMVTVMFHRDSANAEALPLQFNKNIEIRAADLDNTVFALEGYRFVNLFKNADLTTRFYYGTYTEDIDLYVKYEKAITLTYNFGVAGTADVTGTPDGADTYYQNDKVGDAILPIGSVTNGSLAFAGWYLKDGEEWGAEVTKDTVLTEDTTVYAKWVEPSVLMGVWKGGNMAYYSATATTLEIDVIGRVTASGNDFKNAVVKVAEDGGLTIYRPASGSGSSAIGEKTYTVTYDEANGFAVISGGNNPVVLKKVDSVDATVTLGAYAVKIDNTHILSTIKVGDGIATTFMLNGSDIIVNPTVIAEDKAGQSVSDVANYKTLGTKVTISIGGADNIVAVCNSTSASNFFTTNIDNYRGVYVDSVKGNVMLDGVGNIWIGTENTVAGTYIELSANVVKTTISKVYYEVTLTKTETGNTCVVSAPTAQVTYTLTNGTIEGDNPVSVGINVEFTLPTVTPNAGYQFLGWFDNAEFTGNAITKYTLTSTDAKTFFAKMQETPKWASAETAEELQLTDNGATLNGETTALNMVYYVKIVIPTDGLYYISFVNCKKVGGTGNNSANYARVTLFTAVTCASDEKVEGLSAISNGNNGNATLTAGTYYLVVSLGGQVSNNTNDDVYGTFSVIVQKAEHSTADTALTYTVGENVTAAAQSLGNKKYINAVYAVTLEAGKTYKVSYIATGDVWQPISIYDNNTLSGTAVAKPAGSWTANVTKEAEFTATNTGTYYIVVGDVVSFSIVEVVA